MGFFRPLPSRSSNSHEVVFGPAIVKHVMGGHQRQSQSACEMAPVLEKRSDFAFDLVYLSGGFFVRHAALPFRIARSIRLASALASVFVLKRPRKMSSPR